MKKQRIIVLIIFLFTTLQLAAQSVTISGNIKTASGKGVSNATISLKNTKYITVGDSAGNYQLQGVATGNYTITVSAVGYKAFNKSLRVSGDMVADFILEQDVRLLNDVTVKGQKDNQFGIGRLKAVEGTAINAGKKSEVVVLDDITANKASNNTRQIYAKVAGLNIWESDGGGIQLGIGGRGLNPNRVTNFNTRQNGYDISADALGYPESYYSPPAELTDRIEILRGASSLQYGTQFGGLINFKLKEGATDKPIEITSRETAGSYGFFNTTNSIGGTVKKV